MSETASFVDPVFLARFGLARSNVIGEYSVSVLVYNTAAYFIA
jgi:hypothetical protein